MLESDRLLLRRPVEADFAPSAAMFADEAVTRHLGGAPLDRAAAWAKFLRDVGHWAILPFGLFSVIEKGSMNYVGKVGHARFERELGPRPDVAVEMSWTLRSEYHGKGYALEAATLARDWFERLNPMATRCIIARSNMASQRIAQRLDYKEAGRIESDGDSTILLVREAPGFDS